MIKCFDASQCSDEDSRIDIIEEVKKTREEVREVRKDVAHLTVGATWFVWHQLFIVVLQDVIKS